MLALGVHAEVILDAGHPVPEGLLGLGEGAVHQGAAGIVEDGGLGHDLIGAFLNAIPGIILQLIFIPTMMIALDRTGLVRFHRKKHHKVADRC